MSRFEVLVLGNSSALPAFGRHPSAQLINIHEHFLLIDCGEGTQERLATYHARSHKIEHIFISHLHGDHYFGLPGLITSLNLTGRKNPLFIYSPPGLRNLINLITKLADSVLNFEIVWHEIKNDEPELLFSDTVKEITAFPLRHRVPTYGFSIKEKPGKRVFLTEKITGDLPPFELIRRLKDGEDVVLPDGSMMKSEEVSAPPLPPKKYSYCSDTLFYPSIVPFIDQSDLLYHEATYSEMHKTKANENYHSTAREAATIARLAKVKKLMIGHYSSRYKSTDLLLEEAKTIFAHTVLAEEGNWTMV